MRRFEYMVEDDLLNGYATFVSLKAAREYAKQTLTLPNVKMVTLIKWDIKNDCMVDTFDEEIYTK